MAYPSSALKRQARRMRSASSANLSRGSPTARIKPRSISALPPKGSIKPHSGRQAIALMVKSLRARSSSIEDTNVTESGCLPSLYRPSLRKVVTSKAESPLITVIVPCATPVSWVLSPACSQTRFVSAHIALQAISISEQGRPSSASRTKPPTAHASNPASSNTERSARASSGRSIRRSAPKSITTLYRFVSLIVKQGSEWGRGKNASDYGEQPFPGCRRTGPGQKGSVQKSSAIAVR